MLTEDEFFDFHLTTPDLNVMLIRVRGPGLPMGRDNTVQRPQQQVVVPCDSRSGAPLQQSQTQPSVARAKRVYSSAASAAQMHHTQPCWRPAQVQSCLRAHARAPGPPQDKDSGDLVTFCTGVRAGDTLMPMWCGTAYDNEKSRTCSSYFNMLYEVRGLPQAWQFLVSIKLAFGWGACACVPGWRRVLAPSGAHLHAARSSSVPCFAKPASPTTRT